MFLCSCSSKAFPPPADWVSAILRKQQPPFSGCWHAQTLVLYDFTDGPMVQNWTWGPIIQPACTRVLLTDKKILKSCKSKKIPVIARSHKNYWLLSYWDIINPKPQLIFVSNGQKQPKINLIIIGALTASWRKAPKLLSPWEISLAKSYYPSHL